MQRREAWTCDSGSGNAVPAVRESAGRWGRLILPLLAVALAGCGRLDELTYDPPITPQQWCQDRPCVQVGDTIINEPLGTFLSLIHI